MCGAQKKSGGIMKEINRDLPDRLFQPGPHGNTVYGLIFMPHPADSGGVIERTRNAYTDSLKSHFIFLGKRSAPGSHFDVCGLYFFRISSGIDGDFEETAFHQSGRFSVFPNESSFQEGSSCIDGQNTFAFIIHFRSRLSAMSCAW